MAPRPSCSGSITGNRDRTSSPALSIAVMSVTAAVVWLLALRLMHISPAGVSEISLMPIPD